MNMRFLWGTKLKFGEWSEPSAVWVGEGKTEGRPRPDRAQLLLLKRACSQANRALPNSLPVFTFLKNGKDRFSPVCDSRGETEMLLIGHVGSCGEKSFIKQWMKKMINNRV